MKGYLLWFLPFLLAACSVSVTVPLPDQRVPLVGGATTWGRVVYPTQPLQFPSFPAKRVEVAGILEASRPLTLSLDFYARLEDPALDPNCLPLGDAQVGYAYACLVGPEDGWVGSVAFVSDTSTPLSLRGENLTKGVQEGRLWLGFLASGTLSPVPVDLLFRDLKAHVTVGF